MRAAAAVALIACGCASVPMAPRAADAAAKKFEPVPGKANLYVIRPNQFTLSAVLFNVTIDGQLLGRTKVGTYLHAQLAPAQYAIATQSETKSVVTLVAQPGKNYFYMQEVGFGVVSGRSVLLALSEASGRAAVLEAELAESQPPPTPTPEFTPPPAPAPAVPAGCAKDTDCKGDRICTNGACVDPPPRSP